MFLQCYKFENSFVLQKNHYKIYLLFKKWLIYWIEVMMKKVLQYQSKLR